MPLANKSLFITVVDIAPIHNSDVRDPTSGSFLFSIFLLFSSILILEYLIQFIYISIVVQQLNRIQFFNDPKDCSSSVYGISVYGISQARILDWLPFPSPGDLPNPGIKPMPPALAGGFFTTQPSGQPLHIYTYPVYSCNKEENHSIPV